MILNEDFTEKVERNGKLVDDPKAAQKAAAKAAERARVEQAHKVYESKTAGLTPEQIKEAQEKQKQLEAELAREFLGK